MYNSNNLSKIIGQTVIKIDGMEVGSEECTLHTKEGNYLYLKYFDDCCAICDINQIDGDPQDLVGSPIIMSELVSNDGNEKTVSEHDESFTWTFVKFATVKGYVTLRWYGSSNGYYSEEPTALYNEKREF